MMLEELNQVVVLNDRDRRTLAWLRIEVGDQAVADAVASLSGGQKPYLTNLCRILGKKPPDNLKSTGSEQAKQHLAGLHAMLDRKPSQR